MSDTKSRKGRCHHFFHHSRGKLLPQKLVAHPRTPFEGRQTQDTHPLLLFLCADITANVGPRNVLRPPDGLAAFLAPAWFPATRGILQHLRDESSQLCLEQIAREG